MSNASNKFGHVYLTLAISIHKRLFVVMASKYCHKMNIDYKNRFYPYYLTMYVPMSISIISIIDANIYICEGNLGEMSKFCLYHRF